MQALAPTKLENQHALITDHVGLALKIARRIASRLPAIVSREDVESAALLGLTEAASRYDDQRNEPFIAFAKKRIRGAVLDHLRRIDHLSRRCRQDARRVVDATRRLEARCGRPVTEREVAAEMGLSEEEIRSAYRSLQADSTVELDESVEMLVSLNRQTPSEIMERQQQRAALVQALKSLEQRTQLIIALYYQEGLTLNEIGQILNVTESRVCQLRTQALHELRAQLT